MNQPRDWRGRWTRSAKVGRPVTNQLGLDEGQKRARLEATIAKFQGKDTPDAQAEVARAQRLLEAHARRQEAKEQAALAKLEKLPSTVDEYGLTPANDPMHWYNAKGVPSRKIGYSMEGMQIASWGRKNPLKKDKLEEVDLRVAKLVAGQHNIPRAGLAAYIKQSPEERPVLVRRNGRLHIESGHTRIGAALLRGDKKIKAHVWDAKDV